MSGDRSNFWKKRLMRISAVIIGLYAAMRWTAKRHNEPPDIDNGNVYIRPGYGFEERRSRPLTVYEGEIKPAVDKILSFTALLLLSPLFAVIGLAIYMDDPGPVLFTQKRVGKNKRFFALHKFRSMKVSTPHDVPTHQLENPEQYITKIGKVLRKTSLDELPQIWDIFRGKMSIIGPRPALWNQEDLVEEREKYGANHVTPGLTGWAQINGRDELEIEEKARLDGEYTKILRSGNMKGVVQDVKCFAKTVARVLKSDGVIEGGTGARHKQNVQGRKKVFKNPKGNISSTDAGFEDYGYRKTFHIDTSDMNHKKVLITGANSYIGESFRRYAVEYYEKNFSIDTLDMRDTKWRETDFSSYDAVFHVAGLAHADVGHADVETKAKYYAVNRDLAIETARKAKAEGVRQFILMSSMIIYGDSAPYGKEKVIDAFTLPAPANFYGDSKWQADKGVRKLSSDTFHVAVLRSPMIYGKGSKGNYPKLARLTKIMPVFPDVKNRRSILYIGNLCEFVSLLILSGEGGVYFPQNGEYTTISRLVREIGITTNSTIYTSRALNIVVFIASYVPGKVGKLVGKIFGSSVYDLALSFYDGLEYQKFDLRKSIIRTEANEFLVIPTAVIEKSD